MSGWDSPPPVAEQLRAVAIENRDLRAEVERLRAENADLRYAMSFGDTGLREALDRTVRERDAMRPVIDAARAWVARITPGTNVGAWADVTDVALIDAVRALDGQ